MKKEVRFFTVVMVLFIVASCAKEAEILTTTNAYAVETEYDKFEEVVDGLDLTMGYVYYESSQQVELEYHTEILDTVTIRGIQFGHGKDIKAWVDGDTMRFFQQVTESGLPVSETVNGKAWTDGDSLHLDYFWYQAEWAPAPDRHAYVRGRGVLEE